MEDLRKGLFKDLKHIVIKLGTNILLRDDGTVNNSRLNALVSDICILQNSGYSIVLVSSGAIGVGMDILKLNIRPRNLSLKRACAAIGQIHLMKLYSQKFEKRGVLVAQVLLSDEDFAHKSRYNNIRHTTDALISKKVIPIINENDTVGPEEMTVGDNDKLASDVAHFLEADLLIILSDQEGLYTKNPHIYSDAQHISIVPKVTQEIEKYAGGNVSQKSVGGMRSKLKAIKQATEAGTPVVLAHGKKINLVEIVQGKQIGTFFLPNPQKLKRQKRWLAFVSKTNGKLVMDEGAITALSGGKSSLLAVGITGVKGRFKVNDFIDIVTSSGKVIGRGRVSFTSTEINSIKGLKSSEFSPILKRTCPKEVIHRDYLIVFNQ